MLLFGFSLHLYEQPVLLRSSLGLFPSIAWDRLLRKHAGCRGLIRVIMSTRGKEFDNLVVGLWLVL